jgi:hypothetical protein
VLRCYGVTVGFRSNSERLLGGIDSRLIPASSPISCCEPDLDYYLEVDEDHGLYKAFVGTEPFFETSDFIRLFEVLKQSVHHALAQKAVDYLFLHAGVVAWRRMAILLPGRSGSGKSTLVRALISAGAIYFSDEFAVLDEYGLVHPFARPLCLRTPFGKIACDPSDVGAQTATEATPVGSVVFTAFRSQGIFRPTCLAPGRAVLEFLKHVVAVRANPNRALRIARAATSQSWVTMSVRGEACSTAADILRTIGGSPHPGHNPERNHEEDFSAPTRQNNRTDHRNVTFRDGRLRHEEAPRPLPE